MDIDDINTPKATAKDDIRPIAASPFILSFSLNLSIAIEDNVTSGIDTNKGDLFRNKAIAMVAKLTWARPSPIIEYFLKTRNIPKKDEDNPIKMPANIAFGIKSYLNASVNKNKISSNCVPPLNQLLLRGV